MCVSPLFRLALSTSSRLPATHINQPKHRAPKHAHLLTQLVASDGAPGEFFPSEGLGLH
jgi:hypothetical protein